MGNCVHYGTKASDGRHAPREGNWLLAQLRSGGSVRCYVCFFEVAGGEKENWQ